ncbi:MAG: hypothetical protein D6704_08685 [Nitrospirae bacterium]|nr:MAG: hypothetical protein D6704_08685 [Nitrospirota bacterium]
MICTVKLFGMLKSLAGGQDTCAVQLDRGIRVQDFIEALQRQYPQIGDLVRERKVLVSVNQEIAHGDTELTSTDEIALLPPFAGGSGKREDAMAQVVTDDALLARIQRENFSIDEEIERVRARSTRIGGIATFLGIARDYSQGHEVQRITFEYYEGMAQKKLRDIRERALQTFDVLEVLILHRYGDIAVGENIVLIVVGAEHRADAFKACQWCIDELKRITPIWKLEHTPDGQVWVEQHP